MGKIRELYPELYPGAEYHVGSRINRGEKIFNDPAARELFADVLERVKKKYKFHLRNLCLMSNHFHIIIQPEKQESLPRIMQWLKSVFAKEWNKMTSSEGVLWGGVYFSRIIRDFIDFVRTFIYIDENPVRAGLVRHPSDWKYGRLWERIKGMLEIFMPP